MFIKTALYPSGLRGRSAKPLFVGSNPTGASILTKPTMFTVYILRSQKDNNRYIGFTDNLDRRISEHNSGRVISTKNRRPLNLIYTEQFENKVDAMKREKFFKSHQGRNFLNSIDK